MNAEASRRSSRRASVERKDSKQSLASAGSRRSTKGNAPSPEAAAEEGDEGAAPAVNGSAKGTSEKRRSTGAKSNVRRSSSVDSPSGTVKRSSRDAAGRQMQRRA